MAIFSKGNKKLTGGNVNFLQFNLPAIETCPGSTKNCKKFCYAKKAEKMYKNTKNQRAKNLELSKQNDFVEIIKDELENQCNLKYNYIRIHESGDFYNLEYFTKWVKIAKIFECYKNIKFMAYTKSFDILEEYIQGGGEIPKNFIIRLSADDSTTDDDMQKIRRLNMPIYYAGDMTGAVHCRCKDCGSCLLCYGKTTKDIQCDIH